MAKYCTPVQKQCKGLSMKPLVIVCATPRSTETFKETLLAKSLSLFPSNSIKHIVHNNTHGLPYVYNQAMATYKDGDIEGYILIHDDVRVEDAFLEQKLVYGWSKAPILGIAGASQFNVEKPYWGSAGAAFYSGCVWHHEGDQLKAHSFGPTPGRCIVMDGLFLAVRKDVQVKFDERFTFHMYDLDYCLQCHEAGHVMMTIPLHVFHGSHGSFESTAWYDSAEVFKDKWCSQTLNNPMES